MCNTNESNNSCFDNFKVALIRQDIASEAK